MRLILAAAFLAAPSLAQVQTDCRRDFFGNVHCQSNGSPVAPADQGSLLQGGANLVPDYNRQRERAAVAEAAEARLQTQRLRELVGALVADGKCDDARLAALKGGDFDLAERVRKICAAP